MNVSIAELFHMQAKGQTKGQTKPGNATDKQRAGQNTSVSADGYS